MDNLPETITVAGIGTTRTVWIDGECLPNLPYNWGYTKGEGPTNLSKEILKRYFDVKEVSELFSAFKGTVVGFIPDGSFNVKIELKKWVMAYRGLLTNIHAFDLMKICIAKDVYVSKFLDFPNHKIKSGHYSDKTIEYQLLKSLSTSDMNLLNDYVENRTTRKQGFGEAAEDVSAELIYHFEEDYYQFKNGMGSHTSTGTYRNSR